VAIGFGIGVASLALLVAAPVASFASGHELRAEATLQDMSRSLQLHCVSE
jgi:hypothetical protein